MFEMNYVLSFGEKLIRCLRIEKCVYCKRLEEEQKKIENGIKIYLKIRNNHNYLIGDINCFLFIIYYFKLTQRCSTHRR